MNSLQGKTIISTRPLSADNAISAYLTELGATVIDFPMIEVSETAETASKTDIFNKINSFNWIIFTSKNGATYFFDYANKLNINFEVLKQKKYAVIGNKTANKLKKIGIEPCYISRGNTSELFAEELTNGIITKSDNILLALGNLATDTLENKIKTITSVSRVDVYETKAIENYTIETIERIKNDTYNIIIFTSPSGVENFKQITIKHAIENKIRIACIGKTTEKALIANGFTPIFTAEKAENFAQEIENYLTNN